MSSEGSTEPAHQALVNAHFDADAAYWSEIYTQVTARAETVGSLVIRERHETALAWVDRIGLAPGSRALELGAGAGMFSIALARRGFQVDATDAAEEMVRSIARNAGDAGVAERLAASQVDATALPFDDGTFDLVVALGVVSWLAAPEAGIREMARVVRPGGHVLFTTFNRMQLTALLDPVRNPWVRPLKLRAKRVVEATGLRRASTDLAYHDRLYVDGMVAGAGLARRQAKTIGFGPFSLLHKRILPHEVGIAVHHRVQQLADIGVPGLKHGGMFYLVLAQKPVEPPPALSPRS